MSSVTFDGVTKVYDNGFRAVDELDLEIGDGEFMVLVGPSGCGKTTALRMLAGLEDISGGELVIDDRVVNDVAPQKRDIAMVFQNYALYPHGRAALRFQLSLAVYLVAIVGAMHLAEGSVVRVQLAPFLLFLNLMLVLNWLLFAIVAIHRAATGQTFTYPLTLGRN